MIDRSTWTPYQIAFADLNAAEALVHDLTNDLGQARSELDTWLQELGPDVVYDHARDAYEHHIAPARERIALLAEQLAAAQQQLANAEVTFQKANHLTRKQAADMICGLTGRKVNPDTFSGYVTRGQAPSPDGYDGTRPYWTERTIREYAARPVAPGSRTDLSR